MKYTPTDVPEATDPEHNEHTPTDDVNPVSVSPTTTSANPPSENPLPSGNYWGGNTVRDGKTHRLNASTFKELVQRYVLTPVRFGMTHKEFMDDPDRDAKKDSSWISPCSYTHKGGAGKRGNQYAYKTVLVCIDMDDSEYARPFVESPGAIGEHLQPYNFAAYTTAKHTPEAPRLRIIIDVDPCDPALLSRLTAYFAKRLGLPPDFQGKSESSTISQPAYRPAKWKGTDFSAVISSRTHGIAFDPSELPIPEKDADGGRSFGRHASKSEGYVPKSDREVLSTAEHRFPKAFRPLFHDGDWEGRYDSHSDADHALASMLCVATEDDEQVCALFRESSLNRDKTDRPDYLPRSVEKARAAIAEGKFGSKHSKNDTSNADRLVTAHQSDIRYVPEWKTWVIWSGVRWKRDDERRIIELAKGLKEMILKDLETEHDPKRREELTKFAVGSGNAARVKAAADLAMSDPRIIAHSQDFDANPFLGVRNGVVDLKTGTFREARREDMVSKQAAVTFDGAAECSEFRKFLSEFTCGDAELQGFVQRWLGYNLTGDTSEHALVFPYGRGANGKTTLFVTIQKLLGDYAQTAPKSLFIANPRGSSGQTNDVARLEGVRMVVGSELEEGAAWPESKIKDLTGGDVLTARYLHNEFFDFYPTHKLTIFGNHKPRVRGTDEGIWRRILLLPCNMSVPKKKRVRNLDKILLKEAPGILNWLIEGCMRWQENGLQVPESVRAATEGYRSEEDHFGRFVEECVQDGAKTHTLKGEAFRRYGEWCAGESAPSGAAGRFHKRMAERGFRITGDGKSYRNITIRSVSVDDLPDEEADLDEKPQQLGRLSKDDLHFLANL